VTPALLAWHAILVITQLATMTMMHAESAILANIRSILLRHRVLIALLESIWIQLLRHRLMLRIASDASPQISLPTLVQPVRPKPMHVFAQLGITI
jgi:hypothetical protein